MLHYVKYHAKLKCKSQQKHHVLIRKFVPFDELLCAMGKPLFNFQFDSNHQSSIVLPIYHHKLSKYFRIAELGEFFSSPKNCDIIINIFFNCFKMFQNGLWRTHQQFSDIIFQLTYTIQMTFFKKGLQQHCLK